MSKYHPNRWNANPYEKGNTLGQQPMDPRINLTSVPKYVEHKRQFSTTHAYALWNNLSECDIAPIKVYNKHGAVIGFTYGQAYVIYAVSHIALFIYDKQVKQWFEGEPENEPKDLRRTREACRPQETVTLLDPATMDLVRRYGFNAVARLRMQGRPVTRGGMLKARWDVAVRFGTRMDGSKW